MPLAELDGARLYYEQHGNPDGDHVVFHHGAGGNSLSWWRQLPAFGERFRCTVYDARGWGRSLALGEHDRGAFGRDLVNLLEHLGIDQAHVVAQSMGGRAVAGLLRLAPERARSLVLCGTNAGATNDRVRELQASLRVERGEGGLARHALAPHFPDAQPALAALYHQIRPPQPAPANRTSSDPRPRTTVAARTRCSSTPASPSPSSSASTTASPPPNSSASRTRSSPAPDLFEMAGAGHSTYFEQPDVFNDYVLAFLDRAGKRER